MPTSTMKNIESVVKNRLCTGCGTCAGVCPRHSITMLIDRRKGLFLPLVNPQTCISCGECLKACPGASLDFSALNKEIMGGPLQDVVAGCYQNIYSGYASEHDIRFNCTSGGLITALLIYALESHLIDGALVTGWNPEKPALPRPFIARNRQEIISSAGSRYCPVPANLAVQSILETPGTFAVVGLPCHIQGLRKAAAQNARLKEKIVLYLGIQCSHTDTFLMTEFLLSRLKIDFSEVTALSYRGEGWPGFMTVVSRDGRRVQVPYFQYIAWHEFNFFTPDRCLSCCDSLNKLADITLGDFWLPGFKKTAGDSVVVARSPAGAALLQRAMAARTVTLTILSPEIIKKWMPSVFRMRFSSALINWRRFWRRPVPQYNISLPSPGLSGYLAVAGFSLSSLIGRQRWLWPFLPPILPVVSFFMKQARRALGLKVLH